MLSIFCITIISLSLAIAIRQTPELELYKVVRPKKLQINQTETLGKEVSNVSDCGILQSAEETIKSLFTNRSDVTLNIEWFNLYPAKNIGFLRMLLQLSSRKGVNCFT